MLKLTNPNLLRQQCYLNGVWVDSDSGQTLPVTNPATGEVITKVAHCSAAQTALAIDGAVLAQAAWRKRAAAERSRILQAWYHR